MVFVIHEHKHNDCYNEVFSKSNVIKVFQHLHDAVDFALENTIISIDDFYILEENGEATSEYQNEEFDEFKYNGDNENEINYNNLSEKDRYKAHLYIRDESIDKMSRYEFIITHLELFFGNAEFSLLPSHRMYYITCISEIE